MSPILKAIISQGLFLMLVTSLLTKTSEEDIFKVFPASSFFEYRIANDKGMFTGNSRQSEIENFITFFNERGDPNVDEISYFAYSFYKENYRPAYFLVKQKSSNMKYGEIMPGDLITYISVDSPLLIFFGNIKSKKELHGTNYKGLTAFTKALNTSFEPGSITVKQTLLSVVYDKEMEPLRMMNNIFNCNQTIKKMMKQQFEIGINRGRDERSIHVISSKFQNEIYKLLISSIKILEIVPKPGIELTKEENHINDRILEFQEVSKSETDIFFDTFKHDLIIPFLRTLIRKTNFYINTFFAEYVTYKPMNFFLNKRVFPSPGFMVNTNLIQDENFVEVYLNYFIDENLKVIIMNEDEIAIRSEFMNFSGKVQKHMSNFLEKIDYDTKVHGDLVQSFALEIEFLLYKSMTCLYAVTHDVRNELKDLFTNYVHQMHTFPKITQSDIFPDDTSLSIVKLSKVYGIFNPNTTNEVLSIEAEIQLITKKKKKDDNLV